MLIWARRICLAAEALKAFHVDDRLISATFSQLHDPNPGKARVEGTRTVPRTRNFTPAASSAILFVDLDGNLTCHANSPRVPQVLVGRTQPNKNPQTEKISLGIYLLSKLFTRLGQVF